MITKINVFDCDGVLLDSTHRYATIFENGAEKIDLPFWIAHENFAYDDMPLETARLEYAASLADKNSYTIIATAAIVCQNRLDCLRDKIGMPDYIISRKNRADMRGGAELKILGLNKILALKQFQNARKNGMTIYEDNLTYLSKLCRMFNCRGVYIPSLQGH